MNVNAFKFASYANGKAAVRVTDAAAVPAGPHQWRDLDGAEQGLGGTEQGREVEAKIACEVLNRFMELGGAKSERIG